MVIKEDRRHTVIQLVDRRLQKTPLYKVSAAALVASNPPTDSSAVQVVKNMHCIRWLPMGAAA